MAYHRDVYILPRACHTVSVNFVREIQVLSKYSAGLSYCRDMRIVRTHLSQLVWPVDDASTALITDESAEQWGQGLTSRMWESLLTKEGMVSVLIFGSPFTMGQQSMLPSVD